MEQTGPALKFKQFTAEEMHEFSDLGVVESLVTNATVKDVLKTVMDPQWWVKKVGKSSTEITGIEKISKEEKQSEMRYVRDVVVRMGPFKFQTIYNVTQIVESNRAEMHAYDRDGGHLVSQFTCTQEGPNVLVSYAEVMKAGMLVLKLGKKAIKAARIEHLERLQDRVHMKVEELKKEREEKEKAERRKSKDSMKSSKDAKNGGLKNSNNN